MGDFSDSMEEQEDLDSTGGKQRQDWGVLLQPVLTYIL